MNSEQQMNEIEIPTPNQSDRSDIYSEDNQQNIQPNIVKTYSNEEVNNNQEPIISQKTQKLIIKVLDIIGLLGLIIYCIIIQSYYSTFYLLCLLMILNYTYINIYKGVMTKEGKLFTLEQFSLQQEQFNNTPSEINEENQHIFETQYWLEIYDIKKIIWIAYIIISTISLITKLALYPVLKNGGQNIMSQSNFNGLEIYYTIQNGKVTVSSNEQGLSFAPNCIMLALAFLILIFRNIKQKKEFYEFQEPPILTKFLILLMLFNLIILTCCTKSFIGLVMWIFQLIMLFRMFQNKLMEKNYFIILKYIMMTFFFIMYFISTPIKSTILQNSQVASFTLQFSGFQLFGYFSQYEAQAILFIIFSIIVINMLCLINQKINTQKIQKLFEHTIKEITTQYQDYKTYQQIVSNQIEKLSVDLVSSPEQKNSSSGENFLLDSNDIQQEEKEDDDEEQNDDDKQSGVQRLSQYFNEQQTRTSQVFVKLQEVSYSKLTEILKQLDQPLISLIILQILSISIVIMQQTYFSILLVLWLILTGFTQNLQIIKNATIYLNIPSLLINFFTFYYSNISGMSRINNFYQFCPQADYKDIDELPDNVCEKLGFFYQDHSAVNTTIMDITLCLFCLFIKQLEEQATKQKDQILPMIDENIKIGWFRIFLAFLFKIGFLIVIILLYWVGFNEINIIQFIMILLLIIFIVNQSTKYSYQGRRIPFQQKYWIVLLSYISFISLIKYLYILFGVQNNYFVVQILGFNSLNEQWVANWILFYMIVIQYYGFQSKIYDKYSNRLIATISSINTIQNKVPRFRQNFGILETIFGHSLIWITYAINLCFLLFTPYSYLNNLLLLYIGIVFLYHVQSINSEINYTKLRLLWYIYMYLLLISFAYRYIFSFFCVPDLNDKSEGFQKFYQNLQLYYQEAGLYAYSTDNLRSEYLADTLNILFGSFALNQLTKFKKLQDKNKKDNYSEQSTNNVLDLQILEQQKWLKTIIIGIAHINTDLITIYIVLSCVFYLRSAAAFILLTLYLSYFFRVHNKILDLLDEKQIIQRLQQQISKLKQIYLEINLNLSHNEEPKQIKHLNDQIKLLRLTTRIKLKRAIWLYSFYFTALCIFLSYFSQFLSTETFTSIINPPLWVDYTVISFFVFGTYSRQYQITNLCYCGYESNNNDCNEQNYIQTESNMWQESWFYLFLLFVNVIDTACTKILEDDLTKSIENLQEIQEQDQIEEVRLQNLSYEESKEIFDIKYDFISFFKSDTIYKSFEREILIINFFFNKNRFVKILLNEAIFKTFQRTLILLYLSNTLLVNTVFSLFYLTISTILFQMKATVKNTKLLNSLAIFSILFQYFLYLLNWTPTEQEIPNLNNIQLKPNDFNIMAKTNLSQYWLSFLGFESSEIMDCDKLNSALSYFSNQTCETNQLLNTVIVFNCIIVSLIYLYFLNLEWFCNQIYRISIKMKNEFIICHKVLKNNDNQKVIINYNLYRQKNYSFKHILIQTITMNYHLILFGFVLLLCESNRSMFNLCQLLILIFFLYLTEFHFKWPYALLRKRIIRLFYQSIFIISAIIIALYTLLKIPNLLQFCVDAQVVQPVQQNDESDENINKVPGDGLIFYCMEAFNLRITGQIFLIFFISLYFDLQDSNHLKDSQQNYQNRLNLRANMVSRGLAYSYNYQQYKQILKLQEEKNILHSISETIEQKMIIWTKRVKTIQNQDQMKFSSEQAQQKFPQLTASFLSEGEVEIPSDQSFFRKVYLKMIIWMRNDKQSIKFMPFHVLMDYIMQQNKRLQLHMYIKIVNHLRNDTSMYEQRLDILEKIYKRFYSEIGKRKDKLENHQLDKIIIEIMKRYEKLYKQREKDTIFEKLQKKYKELEQTNYNLSKELRFVHIYDENDRIIFEQTKSKYPINKLFTMKTSSLFALFMQDIFKYCLINWDTITNIFIISYYFKNYALFGMILPIVMFTWSIIDIHQKIFWIIAYSVLFFIIIIIFVDSMYGIAYSNQIDNLYIPWYYVLDNSNTFSLFYEIFIIWIITFQVFLQKTFGIFNYSYTQIENIFQGYIRLKANNFNKDMVTEIVEEGQVIRQRTNSVMYRKINSEITKIDEDIQIQGQNQLEKSSLEEDPGTISGELRNELERKIFANPAIIDDKYIPGFFEKTFSYEYARPGIDLYVSIAFVQVILFLYLLFFYNFMTGESQNIQKYLKYNQVPAELVLALVFQMIFMMIERYIVLKGDQKFLKTEQKQTYKNKYKTQFVLKYILQIVILILVVYFVYFYLLQLWKKDINNYKIYNTSIVLFFIIFCIYFYLSALQLRYGYRELKIRNQFLYVYNTTGYLFAQVFYSIPFLYDLKVLMDWTFLFTSLNVFQWFTLEDIHRQLYFTKNQSLGLLRRKLGLKVQWIMKLFQGCCLVFFISICIFGPLVLFSALNPSAELNPIVSGDIQINLINVDTNLNVGLYASSQLFGLDLPFLQTSQDIIDATNNNKITEAQLQKSKQFGGIQRFQLADFSNNKWSISQPLYTQLIKELNQTIDYEKNYTFMFNVTFTFRRENQFFLPTITKFSYPYNPIINGDDGPVSLDRDQLKYIRSASTQCNQTGILLNKFYIEVLRIYQSSATSYNVTPIYEKDLDTSQNVFMNINCSQNTTDPIQGISNWQFKYAGTSDSLYNITNITNANGLLYYAICDKFSVLTSGLSVITIYTSIIIIISSYIRSLFSGQIFLLEFTQMVSPEDLLSICQAISVARQLQNYKKENILYFELIDILRSPELVKIMTGTWQEAFSSQFDEKKQLEISNVDDQEKLKQD